MFNVGKTNGFGFPIGAKIGNALLNFLINHCGLLSYVKSVTDGVMYDKIGKSSRPAIQGVEIIGDTSTYLKVIEFANLALTYIDGVTGLPVVGAWDSLGEFIVPSNNIAGLTTIYNVHTYTLDTQGDINGIYIFQPDNITIEPILCEQFLPPVTSIQINLSVISLQDSYGYTISDGVNYYYDVLATDLIPINVKIANYQNGATSLAYSSLNTHAESQYKGRVKFDIKITDIAGALLPAGDFVDGNYFKSADKYHEQIIADTENILYDVLGDPKVIEIATVKNITNDQLIINKDEKSVTFYEASLTGDCKVNALKLQDLNELFLVSDGEGGYEPFFVDGELMYVLKEGVSRE